jgi:Protein of unknown function (DUF732)
MGSAARAIAHADSRPAAWTANQDTVYVTLLDSNGVHDIYGFADEASIGERIANDLANAVSPAAERNYIYNHTNNTVTLTDANVMVNAAEVAYLGGVLTPSGRIA